MSPGAATSRILPGTVRDYWICAPAQYTPAQPACAMIFQAWATFVDETGRWRLSVVCGNPIHEYEVPAVTGVFVNPGFLPPAALNVQGRLRRSRQYDALNDWYDGFLIEEMLPEAAALYNPNHAMTVTFGNMGCGYKSIPGTEIHIGICAAPFFPMPSGSYGGIARTRFLCRFSAQADTC